MLIRNQVEIQIARIHCIPFARTFPFGLLSPLRGEKYKGLDDLMGTRKTILENKFSFTF